MTRRPRQGPGRGLGQFSAAHTERWIGVEHEYQVSDASRRPVDFRAVVGTLDVGVPHLDPGDPLARRLRSGVLLTADGREAEVATPPVSLRPGFTVALDATVDTAWHDIVTSLPRGLRLIGYSTHLSVTSGDRTVVRTARRFAQTHALSMMLLMDRATSPGLLVRPRRHRLELCAEYLEGESLTAAAVFAAASTLALGRHVAPGRLRAHPKVEAARGRFGYYLDRRAFGPDLYAEGRAARIGRSTADDNLHRCWEWTRPHAFEIADAEEVTLVDDVVDGRRPLPSEGVWPRAARPQQRADSGFGTVLERVTRPGFEVSARVVTWSFVVLEVTAAATGARAYLNVPGMELDGFLTRLRGGELDRDVVGLLARQKVLPVLAAATQTGKVGAYRGVGEAADLLAGERDPATGRLGTPGGPGSRSQKKQSDDLPEQSPSLPSLRRWSHSRSLAVVAAGAVALLIVAGTGLAVHAHGHGARPPAPVALGTPTPTSGPSSGTPSTTPPPAPTSAAPTNAAPTTAVVGNFCSLLTTDQTQLVTGLPIYAKSSGDTYCQWQLIDRQAQGLVEIDLDQLTAYATPEDAIGQPGPDGGALRCSATSRQAYDCGSSGTMFGQDGAVFILRSTGKNAEPGLVDAVRSNLP